MQMTMINEIEGSQPSHPLERMGDWLLSPARLFFGRSYTLEGKVLKSLETTTGFFRLIAKVVAIVLFPLSILSSLAGYGLKKIAHRLEPRLLEKYSLPAILNARTESNFAGRLPPSPYSPNCVNSQAKSCWGQLYNVEPIAIPAHIADPMAQMKALFQTADRPFFKAANAVLTEERENYLHYEYTVTIPSGPLKGVYIDDVDLFYDRDKQQFEIRSASRSGFRDAVHLDFSKPGANKNRVEAIRATFAQI